MKNLFLSIILTSACILGYGQVKGPDKGEKVSSTPTVDRAARPGGPAGNERPVGKERPNNDPSSAAPERSQKPQSQLEREMPSKARGQKPQSQLEREMPSKARGQKPQSQLEREMPSKARGQKPQSQLEREMPSKARGQKPQSQLEREMPSKSRGQSPQSQLEREMPSKSRGQSPQSQLEREMPSKGKPSSVKPSSDNASNNAFCNGWRDGYIKEWNAKSEEVVTPNVPPCEENPNLEGYKNGYKAGMKRAQLDKK